MLVEFELFCILGVLVMLACVSRLSSEWVRNEKCLKSLSISLLLLIDKSINRMNERMKKQKNENCEERNKLFTLAIIFCENINKIADYQNE